MGRHRSDTDSAFSITIEFSTPAIFGRRLNLDALLGHLLFTRYTAQGMERSQSISRAHADIPLVRRDGVFAGSALLIPRCRITRRVITGSLERHLMVRPGIEQELMPNEVSRRGGRAFEKVEKQYKNVLTQFQVYELTNDGLAVWFIGFGNRKLTEDLVSDLTHLGAKTGDGYGRIKDLRFAEARNGDYSGIMSQDGCVMRPIPKTVAEAWGLAPRRYQLAEEAHQPPYWDRENRALCYVPPQSQWSYGEIRQLVGEQ